MKTSKCALTRKTVRGLFTDLSIAFYTVDHKSLNEKLNYYSSRGISNKRFQSYLTNRL